MVNRPMKASAYSIGASNWIDPLCRVAVQLKTLIADGTATMKLMKENTRLASNDCPVTNM